MAQVVVSCDSASALYSLVRELFRNILTTFLCKDPYRFMLFWLCSVGK